MSYEKLKQALVQSPKKWLVTGVAGFIGSNLLESLLKLNQDVVGLDNFSTGFQDNLDHVQAVVGAQQWQGFTLLDGDIRTLADCQHACTGVDYVLHQAALGSVPRSIADPIATNQSNIDGFLNMLIAARDAKVKSFTYAASSSTYGNHPTLPRVEDTIGVPLSPYAITKYVNELYAHVFAHIYNFSSIGLRYFNVFGRRQNPNSTYAAVIPKWITAMAQNRAFQIYGDGETSRDFCYIENAIQANLLAATTQSKAALNQVYNVAVGQRTTLNQLHQMIYTNLKTYLSDLQPSQPVYCDFRQGDVHHSLADITKIQNLLHYHPSHPVQAGLKETIAWYVQTLACA